MLRRQATVLEDEVARREDILRTVTTAAQDAVIMIDNQARVAFWNPAAERIFGYGAAAVHGVEIYQLIVPPRDHAACIAAFDNFRRNGSGTAFCSLLEVTAMRSDGSEFPAEVSLAPVRRGNEWWGVGIVRDITERQRIADERRTRLQELTTANAALKTLNDKLTQAQNQLLQSEKMAAIRQLAAGVAHELNNPIGFVNSNVATLNVYVHDLLAIIAAFESGAGQTAGAGTAHQLMAEKDLPFIRQDIEQLMDESRDGLDRVRRTTQDLMEFSRVGESRWQWADLYAGIDSTLNIVWNELKYNCTVRKEYGKLPLVYCIP